MKKMLLISLLSLVTISAFAASVADTSISSSYSYKCKWCERRYNQRSSVTSHMSRNHPEKVAQQIKEREKAKQEIETNKARLAALKKAKKEENAALKESSLREAIQKACKPDPSPVARRGSQEYPWDLLINGSIRCGLNNAKGQPCSFSVGLNPPLKQELRTDLMKEHLADDHNFQSWVCLKCKDRFLTKENKTNHECAAKKPPQDYDPFE